MKYCPLMSYHREGWKAVDCFEEKCAFADDCGNCLVKQALVHYVNDKNICNGEECFKTIALDGYCRPKNIEIVDDTPCYDNLPF